MDEVQKFLVFFADKDSSKRVTAFKTFIELSIILIYSIFTYVAIYGKFDLLDPTEFSDLYKFFFEGRAFVCVLIFVGWFNVVRRLQHYVFYYFDLAIVSLTGFLSKKLRITAFDMLEFFDVVKKDSKGMYSSGKHFDLVNDLFKYFYYKPKSEILKTLFHNNSLVIQFGLIVIYFVSPKLFVPEFMKTVIWTVMIYCFINQLILFGLFANSG